LKGSLSTTVLAQRGWIDLKHAQNHEPIGTASIFIFCFVAGVVTLKKSLQPMRCQENIRISTNDHFSAGVQSSYFFSFFFFPLLLGKWNGMHGNIGFSRNPTISNGASFLER